MALDEYQRRAKESDQNVRIHQEGLRAPLLGLFGEVGSLLTLPKRVQRERPNAADYRDAVLEELGDVLWYLSNLVSRQRVSLSAVALLQFDRRSRVGRANRNLTFTDYERRFRKKLGRSAFREADFFALGAAVGRLMNDFAGGAHWGLDRSDFLAHLATSLQLLVRVASHADVPLDLAAQNNLAKINSRWPRKQIYPPLVDDGRDIYEMLPRRIEMNFEERVINQKPYVFQRCNGINIGDRLTDNKMETDDYRFHDVFHLSYATYLGWSPVLRALFKVKRKSDASLDENQDGARAILIEEGIATWIFNNGIRNHYYRFTDRIDYSLLKTIRQFVSGYERLDRCALWQWERAILEGFRVFRQLRVARRGCVVADLRKHELRFVPRQHQGSTT